MLRTLAPLIGALGVAKRRGERNVRMNVPERSQRTRCRIAAISLAAFVISFSYMIVMTQEHALYWAELTGVGKVAVVCALSGFLAFWLSTFSHCLYNPSIRHRLPWAVSFVLLSWAAALAYFCVYMLHALAQSVSESAA